MKTLLALTIFGLFSVSVPADAAKPIYVVRFDDYRVGSVEDWLRGKGFQFEQDAKRRDRIGLEGEGGRLAVEAKRPAFGIMPDEAANVPEFTYVEIDWGVDKFPAGASYEQGVRNEALIVMVFLGDERQPSGAFFIPDSPYFIALFLCHGDDRVDHPYVGSYFKKSGRYVCTARPKPGEVVTTRFNLLQAYRSFFDKEGDDDPAVSGIALALDTKKAGDGGRASAFIREIRFFN